MSILWFKFSGGKENQTGDKGARTFRSFGLLKSNLASEYRNVVDNYLDEQGFYYGAPHPEDASCLLVKSEKKQKKNAPKYWDVTFEWNTLFAKNKDPREQQKQPDTRRPTWSCRFVPIQTFVNNDLDGFLLVDRAGSPLDNITLPVYVDEHTITRWEPSVDRAFHRRFMNATNTDNWHGVKPDEGLVQNIAVSETFEAGVWWAQVTYVVLASPKITIPGGKLKAGGFNPSYVFNAGPKEIKHGKVEVIKDGNVVLGRPCPLNNRGGRIDTNLDGWEEQTMFLEFRMVNKIAFAELQLNPPTDLWI